MKKSYIFFTIVIIILSIVVGYFVFRTTRYKTDQVKNTGDSANNRTSNIGNTNLGVTVPSSTPMGKLSEFDQVLHQSDSYGTVGTLTVTGYLIIDHSPCNGEPGTIGCGNNPDYAFFKFSKSDNQLIYDLINKNIASANSVYDKSLEKDKVGLGCYQKENSRIISSDKDITGNYYNDITGSFLQNLLSSNASKQINLKIQLTQHTSDGNSDPNCTATFKALGIAN